MSNICEIHSIGITHHFITDLDPKTRRGMQELSPKTKVSYDDQKFEVEFDVREFRPEELSIKTDGDVLVVLAKHETKTESGGSFVSKQFEQRFTLHSGVREAIQCCRENQVINMISHITNFWTWIYCT